MSQSKRKDAGFRFVESATETVLVPAFEVSRQLGDDVFHGLTSQHAWPMRSRTRFSQSGMAHPGKTVERMEEGAPFLTQGSEWLASRWREAIVAAVASRNFERAMRGSGINLRMSRQTEIYDEENHPKAESLSPSPSHAALRSADVYCFM